MTRSIESGPMPKSSGNGQGKGLPAKGVKITKWVLKSITKKKGKNN